MTNYGWPAFSLNGNWFDVPPVFTTIALAHEHGCGLTGDGAIVCWGPPALDVVKSAPVGRYVAISSGRFFSCAVQADTRNPTCWGINDYFPMQAKRLEFVALASSDDAGITCGVRVDGRVYCGGVSSAYPGPPDPALRFVELTVGHEHVCAATTTGRVMCWTSLSGSAGAKLTAVPDGLMLRAR